MGIRLFFVLVVATLCAALFTGSDMAGSSSGAVRPTLITRTSDYGRILFDGSNRVLYAFTRDPRGRTT